MGEVQEINEASMLTIEIVGTSNKSVKIVGKVKGTKRYQEWNGSANIKINDYETIKVKVRPAINSSLGNESVMLNMTLWGDFNRLSFTLAIRHFKEMLIIASYGFLGFVLVLALLFFKVCRKEFFMDDIIQNEIDSMDVHKIIQNYIMQQPEKKAGTKREVKRIVNAEVAKGEEASQRASKGSFFSKVHPIGAVSV